MSLVTKLVVFVAFVACVHCALSDGQPCSSSSDCRTGYLCYWSGSEACGTQGQCHKVDVESTCGGPLVNACGCDGNYATRSACTSFTNPVRDLDASVCGDGGTD